MKWEKEKEEEYRVISVRTDAIYRPREPLEEDVFAYIRECRQHEIGFSVTDKQEQYPDFTNFGIFWLSPGDFVDFFEEC